MKLKIALVTSLLLLPLGALRAIDYAYETAEPQKTGWPLSQEETDYVMKPEYGRRPGSEQQKHLPPMWPVVPSAGSFGGTSWLDTHANLVATVENNKGPIDVLLVGDSITMQWGAAWKKNFPDLTAVNIGIGGDKTQNVLWRLDHGGVDGLEPRLIILMIGNNNMFFTPETGIEPAALGIKACVDNLREKFPKADVVVTDILPAGAPENRFYEDIKLTNDAVGVLNLESDPKVHVLKLWSDFVNADGTLKAELFGPDHIHLNQAGGYELYASKLRPLVEKILSGKNEKTAEKKQK